MNVFPAVRHALLAAAVASLGAQEPTEAKAAPLAPQFVEPARVELRIWGDPVFRQRFAESYLAETEIEPRVTAAERKTMQTVLDHLAADAADKAIAVLQDTMSKASSAVFDFTLANLWFQQEKLDEALAAYKTAVDKFPKFRRAWKNLGVIQVRQGAHADAAKSLTRVIELGGGDGTTFGLLGFSYGSLDKHIAAESAYRMASLLDPETLDWKMGLARSFFKQKRYADAAALCEALIAELPDRADLWLLQANAYIGLGQAAKAAENYELVDKLGQSTFDSLTTLADIYVNEELYEPAVAAYVRAMSNNPQGSPERAMRAARVLTARGALAECRRLVEGIERVHGERLENGPKKDLLKLRARLAVAEGQADDEARILEQIVALDPLDGEALLLLGQNAGRKGEVEQAIVWYDRAAALEAFEADAKVRHAQLLVGKGRYADALPLLKRAQAIKPRENIQKYLDQVERAAAGR